VFETELSGFGEIFVNLRHSANFAAEAGLVNDLFGTARRLTNSRSPKHSPRYSCNTLREAFAFADLGIEVISARRIVLTDSDEVKTLEISGSRITTRRSL
jgi:hypothetical protein